MSSVIDLVFEREVHGYEIADRYSLASVYFEEEFEHLAKELGITSLTAFYSDDPSSLDEVFEDDFFEDPAELNELKKKMGPEEFFDPDDALKSITVLIHHLKDYPFKLEKILYKKNAQLLIDELIELERSLNLAKSQGVKFYFVLTPD